MRFAEITRTAGQGPEEGPNCKRGCNLQGSGRNLSLPVTAVILNLTSFGLVVLGVLALLVAVTVLHRPPTRPCHRCGRRVRLEKRECTRCGYEFEPVRFGR